MSVDFIVFHFYFRSVFSQSYDTGTGSGTDELHHVDHGPTESAWAGQFSNGARLVTG